MSQSSILIQDQLNTEKFAISFKVLLALYTIVPLCFFVQLIDSTFYDKALLTVLPKGPIHFVLLQILFGTPHILASSILLISNRDYIQRYKTKLISMTLLIIAVFGIGSLFIPYKALYILVACWTVYHVLKQQHGIARGICRLPEREFYTLLWISIAAGVFIYLGIFLKNSLTAQHAEWIKHIAASFVIALVCASFLAQRYVKETLGKYFLWANTLLVVNSFYLYIQEYYFLAILAPRLVHDITAYIFYVTHDYNKHHIEPQNWLYQVSARCNVHVFIVLPLFSIFLTFILQTYGDALVSFITEAILGFEVRKAITLGVIGYLSLMHYYSEGFIWKHGSPLRAFIAFKK